jgi:outer membrane biosynthesis protein TonB
MASPQVPFAVPLQQTQRVLAYGMPVQYGQPMGQYGPVPQFAYGIAGQDPRQSQFVQYPMPLIGGGYPAQYIYPYAPTYVAQYPVAAPTRVTQSPAPAKQDEQPPKPAPPPPQPAEKPKKTKKPKGSNTEYFEMDEDGADVPSFQTPQDPSRFTAVSPGDTKIQDADLKPLAIPSTHQTGREIDPSLQGSLVEDQLADSFLPQYPTI